MRRSGVAGRGSAAAAAVLLAVLVTLSGCGTSGGAAGSSSAAASAGSVQSSASASIGTSENNAAASDTEDAAAEGESLTAASGDTSAEEAGTQALAADGDVTFTDDLDRTVTVDHPKKVAVLIGSFVDVWCLAGGKDSIVAAADDTWTAFDLGLPDSVVNIGGVKSPDAEKILSADPDFIIASSNTQEDIDLQETFEKAGIPTAYFNVSSFGDYLHMLKICTQITGDSAAYEQYGTKVQQQVEDAREKAKSALDGGAMAPTCLYVRASSIGVKVKGSSGNVLGEMLKDLGAVNIADSDTSLLDNLSLESIIAQDPDFIFAVEQASTEDKKKETDEALSKALTSQPTWSSLTAVKNNRYYIMDESLYNLKPNARWGEAYEKLENILYGDGQQ